MLTEPNRKNSQNQRIFTMPEQNEPCLFVPTKHFHLQFMLLFIYSKAKPSQNTPVSGAPVLEKPIMLMKARDDGGKPGTPTESAAQSSGPPSKIEREGQRPTQPVYQIQNRGMSASASSGALDRELL